MGDIDRGGVFASLYGTVKLLEPDEQNLICGLIINKFRGDLEILRPGLEQLEALTGKPVLGVVPYHTLDLDEEDSLSERLEHRALRQAGIQIAVVRLPHLSNFTDFRALEGMQGVGVRYVTAPEQLIGADLIVLPGTKSTMDDLRWLENLRLGSADCAAASSRNTCVGNLRRLSNDGTDTFRPRWCGEWRYDGRHWDFADGDRFSGGQDNNTGSGTNFRACGHFCSTGRCADNGL